MFHTFDTEVAEIFHDANIATLFQNLCYWILHNRTNDKNCKSIEIDGVMVSRYFTFNSIQAFLKQFPYYSKKQIETYLSKLKEKGLIVKANFNEKGFDRTSWYCLVDEEYWMKKYLGSSYVPKDAPPVPPLPGVTPSSEDTSPLTHSNPTEPECTVTDSQSELMEENTPDCEDIDSENLQSFHFPKTGNGFPQTGKWISPKREMDFPKTGNGFPQNGKPIPNINSYPKPNNKQNTASASSVLRILDSLESSFIFDREFYQAAADFINSHGIGEEYIRWLYTTLKALPDIKNLRGYYFRVFFRDVYVQRFLTDKLTKKQEEKDTQQRLYTCPVCGHEQTVIAGIEDCTQCKTPIHPAPDVLARCKALYAMDEETRELYTTAKSRIFRSGGNVSENLLKLDRQFGIVS